MNVKKTFKIIVGAVELAILFLPAHFLNEMLSYNIMPVVISLIIIPVFVGILSCIAIYSEKTLHSFSKLALSVPVTILFWYVQIKIQFSVRSLNWIFPGHGDSSAGGLFFGFGMLISLAFFAFIGDIYGIALNCKRITQQEKKKLLTVQNTLIPALCAGIIIAIAALNAVMPPYTSVS